MQPSWGAREGAWGWEFAGRKKMLFSRRKKGGSRAAVVMAFPPAWEKIPGSFQHLMAPSQLLGAPRSCSRLHPPAAAGGVPCTQGGWPRAATSVFGPLGPAVTSQAICSPEPPVSPRHLHRGRRVPSPVPGGGTRGDVQPTLSHLLGFLACAKAFPAKSPDAMTVRLGKLQTSPNNQRLSAESGL